jgi:molecular chaperone DnaK
LRTLGWRKQATLAESESVYTTDPDPVCAPAEPGYVLGIDLGTTHSAVAVLRDGKVEVIPNQEGQLLTPSVVAFTETGEVLVGSRAQQRALHDPRRTVTSIKRLLGRTAHEARAWADQVGYEVASGPRETPEVIIDGRPYSPVEILALILRKLKDAAETHLGQPARRAVVTVPACFTDAQRQAVLAAAELAGFDLDWVLTDPRTGHKIRQRMRIISEPTAAALALDRGRRDGRMVVLHMGGGTFDITVLDSGQGVLEVKAVGGDTRLGGDDFDQALVDHLLGRLLPKVQAALRRDAVACQRLRLAAEQAKRDLSQCAEVRLDLPGLVAGRGGLSGVVTRGELETLVQPLLDRCRKLIEETLAESRLRAGDIAEVVTTGGMTRMPRLRELFQAHFPTAVHRSLALAEVVAMGAAIQGEQLDLGGWSDFVVLDVTPLGLGLETAAGEYVRLVEPNSTIPLAKKEIFTVAVDGQLGVSVRVFQEEGRTASLRKCLGQLDLEGLDGRCGQTKVEVTFEVDHNGILRVAARDLVSGRERSMRMVPRLPAALIQARHQLHQAGRRLERLLADRGGHLTGADVQPLRRLLERARAVAGREDVALLRQAIQEVECVADALLAYLDGEPRGDLAAAIMAGRSRRSSPWGMNLEI